MTLMFFNHRGHGVFAQRPQRVAQSSGALYADIIVENFQDAFKEIKNYFVKIKNLLISALYLQQNFSFVFLT